MRSIDGQEIQMLLYNRHGSVIANIQPHHSVFFQYSPYGRENIRNNFQISKYEKDEVNGHSLNISANPLRYSGYYFNSSTGLYYLKSRDYNPYLRSFLQMDSYAFNAQRLFNGYFYGDNNPLMGQDSSGHIFENEELPIRLGFEDMYKILSDQVPELPNSGVFVITQERAKKIFSSVKLQGESENSTRKVSLSCGHAAILSMLYHLEIPVNKLELSTFLQATDPIVDREDSNAFYYGMNLENIFTGLAETLQKRYEPITFIRRKADPGIDVLNLKVVKFEGNRVVEYGHRVGRIEITDNHTYFSALDKHGGLTGYSFWNYNMGMGYHSSLDISKNPSIMQEYLKYYNQRKKSIDIYKV
ncbi:RHS repeat-associated core domain-containing protein [Cysteiniphilum halobium]|uniref:RHS repeat-associated core domain-containing protein n=1 Tax=Cysteiniphilum halobium TaxID=2219059 RepID=UPI003F82FBD5